MIRSIIPLATIVILCCCTKHDKETDHLPFDTKNLSGRETHHYTFYPDGKISSDSSVLLVYDSGLVIDTLFQRTKKYFYDTKGNVERVFDLADSSERVNSYNAVDSLVSSCIFVKRNMMRDTFMLFTFEFENNKKVRSKSLMFMEKKAPWHTVRDSMGSESVFSYDGDLLRKEIRTYKSGEVIEVHYHATSRKGIYDEIVFKANGDTSTINTNIFQDSTRMVVYEYPPGTPNDTLYYDQHNRLIRKVHYEPEYGKYVYFSRYDEHGNLTDQFLYNEPNE